MTLLVTVDSSVFLASLIEKEKLHRKTTAFFQRLLSAGTKIVVPSIVVCEVVHILNRYSASPQSVNETLLKFQDRRKFEIVPIDADFIEQFLKLSGRFPLKTSDAIIATVAYSSGARLVSWDKKLISKCRGNIEAITPDEF